MSDQMQTQQMPSVGGAPPQTPAGPAGGEQPPRRGGVPVWVYVVTIVVVVLLAVGGMWLVQANALKQAQDKLDATQMLATDLSAKVDSLTQQVNAQQAANASAAAEASKTSGAAGSASGTKRKPKTVVVRQFTYVKKMSESGGHYKMTADFAQMLTGAAAAAAATAHGAESPPPNDYFIVNDNPKLRVYPVKSSIKVKIYGFGGGDSSASTLVPLGQFFDLMPGGVDTQEPWKSAPYWITITNGTITKIEQQYLP